MGTSKKRSENNFRLLPLAAWRSRGISRTLSRKRKTRSGSCFPNDSKQIRLKRNHTGLCGKHASRFGSLAKLSHGRRREPLERSEEMTSTVAGVGTPTQKVPDLTGGSPGSEYRPRPKGSSGAPPKLSPIGGAPEIIMGKVVSASRIFEKPLRGGAPCPATTKTNRGTGSGTTRRRIAPRRRV